MYHQSGGARDSLLWKVLVGLQGLKPKDIQYDESADEIIKAAKSSISNHSDLWSLKVDQIIGIPPVPIANVSATYHGTGDGISE